MHFNIIVCPSYSSAPEDIDSCGFIELGIRDGVSTLGISTLAVLDNPLAEIADSLELITVDPFWLGSSCDLLE